MVVNTVLNKSTLDKNTDYHKLVCACCTCAILQVAWDPLEMSIYHCAVEMKFVHQHSTSHATCWTCSHLKITGCFRSYDYTQFIQPLPCHCLSRLVTALARIYTAMDSEEFSQLRVRGYSFNLVDLGKCISRSRMEQMLIAQLDSTVKELNRLSKQRIAKIYIGKTYIPRKKAVGKRYMSLNCLDPNTWRMTGIRNRWRDHHRQNYGCDGLVVLCAITKETVSNRSQMSQEDLAQAMERRLLDHYLFDHPETGVVNEIFTTGNLSEHNPQHMEFT